VPGIIVRKNKDLDSLSVFAISLLHCNEIAGRERLGPLSALSRVLLRFHSHTPHMYIIAIAWIYVVLMMSVTETSIVAGVMTFLLYGALPVGILYYLAGSGRRRRRRQVQKHMPDADSGKHD
jgi:hypothetical protein